MYLNNYLLKYCKENDLSLIIKSLANAAVEISSSIRNIKKFGSNISAEKTSEFAINAAYKRFWNAITSKYIKDCQDGEEGSRKKNFGMRWVGSLVADASRIFIRGGIFLYPADNRKNYKDGRLRLTYEANPIAFLIEQAGGKATNGYENILNLEVKDIHQRSPLIFGSLDEVLIYKRHYEII